MVQELTIALDRGIGDELRKHPSLTDAIYNISLDNTVKHLEAMGHTTPETEAWLEELGSILTMPQELEGVCDIYKTVAGEVFLYDHDGILNYELCKPQKVKHAQLQRNGEELLLTLTPATEQEWQTVIEETQLFHDVHRPIVSPDDFPPMPSRERVDEFVKKAMETFGPQPIETSAYIIGAAAAGFIVGYFLSAMYCG